MDVEVLQRIGSLRQYRKGSECEARTFRLPNMRALDT